METKTAEAIDITRLPVAPADTSPTPELIVRFEAELLQTTKDALRQHLQATYGAKQRFAFDNQGNPTTAEAEAAERFLKDAVHRSVLNRTDKFEDISYRIAKEIDAKFHNDLKAPETSGDDSSSRTSSIQESFETLKQNAKVREAINFIRSQKDKTTRQLGSEYHQRLDDVVNPKDGTTPDLKQILTDTLTRNGIDASKAAQIISDANDHLLLSTLANQHTPGDVSDIVDQTLTNHQITAFNEIDRSALIQNFGVYQEWLATHPNVQTIQATVPADTNRYALERSIEAVGVTAADFREHLVSLPAYDYSSEPDGSQVMLPSGFNPVEAWNQFRQLQDVVRFIQNPSMGLDSIKMFTGGGGSPGSFFSSFSGSSPGGFFSNVSRIFGGGMPGGAAATPMAGVTGTAVAGTAEGAVLAGGATTAAAGATATTAVAGGAAVTAPAWLPVAGIAVAAAIAIIFLYFLISGPLKQQEAYVIPTQGEGTPTGGGMSGLWPISCGCVIEGPGAGTHSLNDLNAIDIMLGNCSEDTFGVYYNQPYPARVVLVEETLPYGGRGGSGNYGNHVILSVQDGPNGSFSLLYAHMINIVVSVGQELPPADATTGEGGTLLGTADNTGMGDPHLHFEVRRGYSGSIRDFLPPEGQVIADGCNSYQECGGGTMLCIQNTQQ